MKCIFALRGPGSVEGSISVPLDESSPTNAGIHHMLVSAMREGRVVELEMTQDDGSSMGLDFSVVSMRHEG